MLYQARHWARVSEGVDVEQGRTGDGKRGAEGAARVYDSQGCECGAAVARGCTEDGARAGDSQVQQPGKLQQAGNRRRTLSRRGDKGN